MKMLLAFLFFIFGVLPLTAIVTSLFMPSDKTDSQSSAEASRSIEAAPSELTNEQAVAQYKAGLDTILSMSEFISDIRPGLIDGLVEIEVTAAFREESKPVREDFAVALWEAWVVALDAKDDVDAARIHLVSRQGQQVGGSRTIGGSVIYVED